MKIKSKFLLMTGVPSLGLLAVVLLAWVNLTSADKALPRIDSAQNAVSLILNADRDAYQAYVAEILSANTNDPKVLQQQEKDNQDNVKQTTERIEKAAALSSAGLDELMAKFRVQNAAWAKGSREAIERAKSTMQRQAQSALTEEQMHATYEQTLQAIAKLKQALEKSAAKTGAAPVLATTTILFALSNAHLKFDQLTENTNATDSSEVAKLMDNTRSAIAAELKNAIAPLADAEGKALADTLEQTYQKWQETSRMLAENRIADRVSAGTTTAAMTENFKVFSAMRDTINLLGEKQQNNVETEVAQIRTVLATALEIFILTAAVILLITLISSIYFVRDFDRAIRCLTEHIKRYSKGDITRIESWIAFVEKNLYRRRDELGDMTAALRDMREYFNDYIHIAEHISERDLTDRIEVTNDRDFFSVAFSNMLKNLTLAFQRVGQTVDAVVSGSGQVNSTAQSLSQGATEQAASLEQIGASMADIGSQVKKNAENSAQANQLARHTADAAAEGQKQMDTLAAAMKEINNNASTIKSVIKVIDELAFQTNLLALNAAVEAARAGQHGKGFAVVAEEVRNLAGRSAKAAKETAELIENSNRKIFEGATISEQTARTLNKISEHAVQTNDIIAEIAAASQEQSNAVQQIAIGLQQIDAVTQQNTANSEEAASCAMDMDSNARILQQLVGEFRLPESYSPGHVAAVPAAQPARRAPTNDWAAPMSALPAPAPASRPDPNELIRLD